MIVVKIANVDRSGQVITSSIAITDQLNQTVNNASFTMQRIAGSVNKTFKPVVGMEVIMEDGETRIFGGVIIEISETVNSASEVRYQVKCKDYTYLLDGKLVVEKYSDTTIEDIIKDMYHRYLVDWTIGNASVNLPTQTDIYSFEYPVITSEPGLWLLRPPAYWGFAGRSGIVKNGSAYGQPDAPDGVQAGFVQDDAGVGEGAGYMYKYFSPIVSGYYVIAFKACKRAGYSDATVDFKINGVVKDSITISNTAYKQYYTKPIYMVGGFSELGIQATGSNMTAFFDDVNFSTPNNFSVQYVSSPIAVKTSVFNRITFSQSLEKLSKLSGYSWSVDYYKNIYFFEKNSIPAPFELTDTNNKYIFETLELAQDLSQLRNRVYIRGGEAKGATRTEVQDGDGVKKTFTLANKFATIPLVKVGGVVQTVGLDYVNNENDFDCLWSFQEKYVKWRVAPPHAGGNNNLEFIGEPLFPVQVQVEDADSIAQYGTFEYSKKDLTIKSKEEALKIAQAELYAYGQTIEEGEFDTYEPGLVSGQLIRIQSDIRGIDEVFLIQKVILRQVTTGKNTYHVSLATLRTVGIIDLLISLLRSEDRYIDDSSDETIEKSAFASERIRIADAFIATPSGILVGNDVLNFSDSFVNQGLDYPVEFVLGDMDNITFFNSDFEVYPPGSSNTLGYFIDNTTSGSQTDKGYGWSISQYNGYAKFDTAEKYSGNCSMKLGCNSGVVEVSMPNRDTGGVGGYFNRTRLKVLPNTSYSLDFYMKTTYYSGSSTSGAYLCVLEVNADGNPAGQEFASTAVQSTTGWTKYTINFTTTVNTRYLQIQPRIYGHTGAGNLNMEAWFDEISYKIVSPARNTKRQFLLDASPIT